MRERAWKRDPAWAGGAIALIVGWTLAAVLVAASAGGAAGGKDGGYRGAATDLDDGSSEGKVSFVVAKGGSLIKNFRASPLATCVNPNAIGGIEVVEVPFALDRVKVKPNGRFARSETFAAGPPSGAKQTYELSGRLRKGRVRGGRIVLERRCSDRVGFTAKRAGG